MCPDDKGGVGELAKTYLRLAQQADRDAAADIVNEQAAITQQPAQSAPGRRRDPA